MLSPRLLGRLKFRELRGPGGLDEVEGLFEDCEEDGGVHVRTRTYGRCYYPGVDKIALPGERSSRYVLFSVSSSGHCEYHILLESLPTFFHRVLCYIISSP